MEKQFAGTERSLAKSWLAATRNDKIVLDSISFFAPTRLLALSNVV
jgi:hypothetical protein